MSPSPKLLDFFRRELQREEDSGFARLSRIPDSHVVARLAHYRSLRPAGRAAFADCCAHSAHARYGFVVDAPSIDQSRHPYFSQWSSVLISRSWETSKSVPLLRAAVQQYKIDAKRGVSSCVSKEEFQYASSIHSIKAPELRKRMRAALQPLGYYRMDELGAYCCRQGDREFRVHVDYGGAHAQLRYVVSRPEFTGVHPLAQFSFERALGFGQGDWDFIVDENVEDAFRLLSDLVRYSYELPDRIRADCG